MVAPYSDSARTHLIGESTKSSTRHQGHLAADECRREQEANQSHVVRQGEPGDGRVVVVELETVGNGGYLSEHGGMTELDHLGLATGPGGELEQTGIASDSGRRYLRPHRCRARWRSRPPALTAVQQLERWSQRSTVRMASRADRNRVASATTRTT